MDNRQKLFLLFSAGVATWYVINNQTQVQTAAQYGAAQLEAATMGWKNAGSGPIWLPILNNCENLYGLPQDMLAAVAFQECSFVENTIRGLSPSSDGLSLGIMQLQTRYYPALVGPQIPVPYTDQNVSDQIDQAGQVFASNYSVLNSWVQTIAAWNQGLTGVQNNGITSTSYVAKIVANAPAANV